MTLDPIVPAVLLAALALAGVAACVALAVRHPARRTPWLLRAGAAVVLAVALARPGTTLTVDTSQVEAAADVFILADTSASAAAEDWDGERPRLEGMREDIAAIVEAIPGARYSLITFDSTAVARMPLTTDTSAMLTAAEVLRPEISVYSGGTSVGVAAELLRERLASAQEDRPDSARLVFYLGDGEQTAEDAPESFEDCAPLISGGGVFGYGTPEGGRMRAYRGVSGDEEDAYIRDPSSGRDAVSVIDEAALETIAAQLGVEYETRSAASEATLEVDVTGTVTEGATEDVGRSEVTWALLALVLALVTVDLALTARQWRLLRRHAAGAEA